MTHRQPWGRGGLLVPAMMMVAAPAAAQQAGATPTPAASPTATPLPVPPPPVIVIPQATPTPTATPARAAPRPTASETPRASRTAAPPPEPAARDTPSVEATPPVPPTSPPSPIASPAPALAPTAAPGAGAGAPTDYWPIVAAAALLTLGWVVLRRRREAQDDLDEGAVDQPDVDAAPAARARLALGFRPIRAGLNLLSATSENEITVTNTGDAPADDIRLLARLISAHTGQDAELAALYAAPIGRPATPAFALQPGEQRVLTTVAALPRDAIRTLTAGGRPMFVPIVAVNLTYATGGGEGQFAQAFAVGIERVDSSKLAPFWLDAPPRTYDQVAARPHAAALER